MHTLTVLVGLPGSGKSTFLSFVDDPEFSDTVFVYSTDRYIEQVAKESGKTYTEVFKDNIGPATKEMDRLLQLALDMGVDVYWDQTNMSPKKRQAILSKFPSHYRKVCRAFAPPRTVEEWAELEIRLAFREGKTIPPHVIKSMADSYVEPELSEGFELITIQSIDGIILDQKVA